MRKTLRFEHFWDCFMHWSGLNSDLKHFLKHIFKGVGAILSKIELTNK